MVSFRKSALFALLLVLSSTRASVLVKTSIDSELWKENEGKWGTLAWRLPTYAYPAYYDLYLNLDLEKSSDFFEGVVDIDVRFSSTSEELWLLSRDLDIKNITMKEGPEKDEVAEVQWDQKEDVLIIKMLKNDSSYYQFEPDAVCLIQIAFQGKYGGSEDLGILLIKDNQTEADTFAVVADFLPNGARQAFPCFDEPGFISFFKLSIEHDAKLQPVVNEQFTSSRPKEGSADKVVTAFENLRLGPISSRGFALLSGFRNISYPEFSINPEVKLTFYTPSSEVNGKFVNETLVRYHEAARMLEKYLGFLPDFDVTEVSHIEINEWNVTEIVGNSIFLSDLAFKNEYDDDEQRLIHYYGSVYACFGHLLLPKSWNETWLSLSVSLFLTNKVQDMVDGDTQASDLDNFNSCHRKPQSDRNNSIVLPDETPLDSKKIFNVSAIALGSCFLEMLEVSFGSDVIRGGLIGTLDSATVGSGFLSRLNQKTFFNALNEATANKWQNLGQNWTYDMSTMLEPWTTARAFPLLNVTVDFDKETVDLQQLDSETLKPLAKFWIPLRLASVEKQPGELIFMPPVEHLSLDFKALNLELSRENCLYLDMKDRALYTVNYDMENLKCLSRTLKEQASKISPWNRATIVRNFADESVLRDADKFVLFLDLMQFLKNETDPYVIASLCFLIEDENLAHLIDSSPLYKQYMRSLITPMAIAALQAVETIEPVGPLHRFSSDMPILIGYLLEVPETVKHFKDKIMKDLRNKNFTSYYLSYLQSNCKSFTEVSEAEFHEILEVVEKNVDNVADSLRFILPCLSNEKQKEALSKELEKLNKSKNEEEDKSIGSEEADEDQDSEEDEDEDSEAADGDDEIPEKFKAWIKKFKNLL